MILEEDPAAFLRYETKEFLSCPARPGFHQRTGPWQDLWRVIWKVSSNAALSARLAPGDRYAGAILSGPILLIPLEA